MLRRNEALAQLIERGADQDLLAEALRRVVFDAVTNVVMVLDEGHDPEAPGDAPGWLLAEMGQDGNATGRPLAPRYGTLPATGDILTLTARYPPIWSETWA